MIYLRNVHIYLSYINNCREVTADA